MQFKEGYPNFALKEIKRDEIPRYWGYKVKERGSLAGLLSSWSGNIIITSRKGKVISKDTGKKYAESQKELLVVFGSTSKGVHEIIGNKIKQIQNSKVLNFFPNQATETVRLEEAILGVLSILNLDQT